MVSETLSVHSAPDLNMKLITAVSSTSNFLILFLNQVHYVH